MTHQDIAKAIVESVLENFKDVPKRDQPEMLEYTIRSVAETLERITSSERSA